MTPGKDPNPNTARVNAARGGEQRSSTVELRNLVKRFGRDVVAVNDVDLHIDRGELVTLLGPSGCGKTTILRMIAGLERPSEGTIHLDEDDVTRLPAYLRDVTMVFQSYALFPHMSVFENVAYGLRVARRPKDEIAARVAEALDMVGLGHLGERATTALSGGQQQRVALARALVIHPRVLLFDEPLSNLDAKLRKRVRDDIRELQQRLGITAVYVTHDQEEAFSISDRVAIMHQGRIMQLDTPEVLYQRPANAFVARFVGFENLISMKVIARDGGNVTAQAPGGVALALPKARFGDIPDDFVLAARADGLAVTADPDAKGLPATLGLRTYLGRAYQYQCETEAGPLIANGPLSSPLEPGSTARLVPVPDQCCVLGVE